MSISATVVCNNVKQVSQYYHLFRNCSTDLYYLQIESEVIKLSLEAAWLITKNAIDSNDFSVVNSEVIRLKQRLMAERI